MSTQLDSITELISYRFNIERSEIVPEATFEELGMDSLSLLELALTLKKKLGIVISDDDMVKMATVSDIISALGETEPASDA